QATRDGDVTTYSYTPAGQLRSVYLSAGYGFFYDYDNAQRLVSVTDTRGPVLNYSLDAMGNPAFENLSYGNTAIQKVNTFDALGRLSTIRGGEGRMTVFNHDANGAVTAVAHYDESTGYQLDALGRPVLITTADGAAT